MGLFSKLNRIAADTRRAEEALYAMAAEEVANGDVKPGLWAKAFAESEGQEAKAQAAYLKLRVQQMRDELAAIDRVMGRIRKEYGDDAVGDQPANPHSASQAHQTDSAPAGEVNLEDSGSASSLTPNWLVAAMLVLPVAAIIIAMISEQSPPKRPVSASIGSSATAAATSPPTRLEDLAVPREPALPELAPPPFHTTALYALIPEDARSVTTIGGRLAIVNSDDSVIGQHLTLNGQRLDLQNDFFSLVSISRHPGQDIILVANQCAGSACSQLDLAFIRVFPGRPPVVETADDFHTTNDFFDRLQQSVSSTGAQTQVALGLNKGAFVSASIGPQTALRVTREWAPIEPLAAEDCGVAKESLDLCAEFQTACTTGDYRDFPNNCPDAPMAFYRTVAYLTNHTTGFNMPSFAAACTEASRLRLTPSDTLITEEICSGADPAQWAPAEDAVASTGNYAPTP